MSRIQNVVIMSVAIFFIVAVFRVNADSVFDSLYAHRKYQDAVDYAENSIPVSARTPEVRVLMGKAYEHLGFPEKALATYLVSWRMNPGDYQSLLGAARTCNLLENSEMALEMAHKALQGSYSAEAGWEYAKACLSLGKTADARKALAKVVQYDSSNTEALHELVSVCFNERDWAAAIPLYKRLYASTGSAEIAFNIGMAYGELGVPDSAISYLEKDTKRERSSLYKGRAFFELKEWSKCIHSYHSVADSTLQGKDFYRLAVATEESGAPGEARTLFEESVTRFGSSTDRDALCARKNYARLLIRSGNFNDAVAPLREIISADPKGVVCTGGHGLLAEAYFGSGVHDSAISLLEQAISLNPKNVAAYALLADCYQKKNMPEKVNDIYGLLSDMASDNPGVYYALATYHFSKDRFNVALNYYNKCNRTRKSGLAYEGIALSAVNLKDYGYALAAADSALIFDSTLVQALLVKVTVLLYQKQFDAARGYLEDLRVREPENLEALHALAKCYVHSEMRKRLLSVDKSIVRLDASDTASRRRLSEYYFNEGSFDESIRYSRELHVLQPDNPAILRRLSQLTRLVGNQSEAVSWLRKYLGSVPEDAEALRDLGNLLYKRSNFTEALSCYRKVKKLDPALGGYFTQYADIVKGRGEVDEVVQVLRGMLRNGTADFSTYQTLGTIYQTKNELIDAIEMYQAALRVTPDSREALSALALCQAENGDIRDAVLSYEQVILMSPDSVSCYRMLGNLYMQDDRESDAMKMYMKYLSRTGSDTAIAKTVARHMFSKGMMREAVYYFDRAGSTFSLQTTLEYVEACLSENRNKQAIKLLLSLKNDRKIQGEAERKVYRFLAQAFENDSNYTEASAAYGEYLGLQGVDDREAAFKQASLLNIVDPSAAQRVYELNCRKYPSDFRNFLNLALIYSMRKDMVSKAIPLLKKVTLLADSLPEVWLELGRIYAQTGNRQDELTANRNYVKYDPRSVEANHRIATLLIRNGEYHEGVVYLEIALDAQPDNPEIMKQLADGYVYTGRFKDAVHLLKKAVETSKDDPELHFQLFRLYHDNGWKEEARLEIEKLVTLSQKPEYLLLYTEALIIQENFTRAEEVLKKLLSEAPDDRVTLLVQAKLFRARKKYDEAIENYKLLTTLDPTDAEAIFERAEAHREQQKLQWAETFYKRTLRIDPSYGRAELGLALIAKSLKNNNLYDEHLKRARNLAPDDKRVLEELKHSVR